MLDSEIMSLPLASLTNGVTGYFRTPALGSYKFTVPASYLRGALVPAAKISPFQQRKVDDQYLEPWTLWERKSFGLGKAPDQSALEGMALPIVRNIDIFF